jgi:hypothetical protein
LNKTNQLYHEYRLPPEISVMRYGYTTGTV